MRVAKNVHELIGHTPVVEITQFPLPEGVRVFAKLESFNPGGSIKDRLGQELLRDALETGKLKEGGTIIEPTAGNTGIGLALAAIGKNINVIFCVPEKFSIEKQQIMKALGATIVHTPTSEGMQGAIRKAQELASEIPNSYCPQQFANPANPRTYYKTLGPELWEDLDGQIDIFVAGAGSGGTFMGTATFLKEKNPNIKTVIVEPEGSILNGGEPGPHKTEGIGMEFLPDYMDPSYFDAIHTIRDEDAFRRVKELAAKEGLLVGSSSGAAFHAALLEAEKAKPGTNIVVIFPDSSERYLSKKIYEGGI
ncbi:PLP-dependent cysteine synthase family protein [Saccharococcus caldoxylosilyticus]|jgi:cystathionine beta-synthase (O-acetyl-L-serine)|uniref:O-acetylserine (thiol)-lyase n=2 Tax=Saccharococcus caldoxylosilyticus TaxID=81408 RepID=A0A023D9V4_9BACL|nr:cysteine synthase family protein [Parageobacillus caldoxylosilyticus]OQP05134.1 cysteine synthase [Geobacillus sp. 44B]KYD12293.1 Cystathionine beta-synthase [Parageobacillus caldoxylosilyticus]MBB3850949.1 O-acetylserine dependent cystathionine beta-synthase [Parageobacillus caldoxylosilyticus]QNU36356.1 cysteine synthase family protein [Geobacillus sp. 44B]QXJ39434.1 O-acetylserine dependent cystathionine beta-synthase [Parageobacillus caldoxylosilyticus]